MQEVHFESHVFTFILYFREDFKFEPEGPEEFYLIIKETVLFECLTALTTNLFERCHLSWMLLHTAGQICLWAYKFAKVRKTVNLSSNGYCARDHCLLKECL